MNLGSYLTLFGSAMSVFGMIVEAVAIIGMSSYRVRRVLPVDSPIALQAFRCTCFCGGACCLFVGPWLR